MTTKRPVRARSVDAAGEFTAPSGVRRVLVELPAGEGATCPLCAAAVACCELVDAHDVRRVGFRDLFEEPSEGSVVAFAPCGCTWNSATDDRVFIASPLGEGLGFRIVPRREDAPDLVRGRARLVHPTVGR